MGKTTLLRQSIKALLDEGIPAINILYVTFDHPIIKMVGVEKVIQAWIEREPAASGPRYLFLDEVQFLADWQVWVKHQVDFNPDRRIIFTGSAVPLVHKGQESGVGRWHTIRLTTLSFFENLQLKKSILENYLLLKGMMGEEKITEIKSLNNLMDFPEIKSLKDLFELSNNELQKISEMAVSYIPYFNQYLIRGGFPQTVQVETASEAQSLIREDIIDKVLKRDMTALFGVRKFIELEQVFIYLCMNDGGILKLENLAENLNVSRTTALHL